jgi:hypothetical protein
MSGEPAWPRRIPDLSRNLRVGADFTFSKFLKFVTVRRLNFLIIAPLRTFGFQIGNSADNDRLFDGPDG